MDSREFKRLRRRLSKTQTQLAQLLGTSAKAVQSYEQGWRAIPAHVERQLLFLISRTVQSGKKAPTCWEQKQCPTDRREQCPSWEFQAGRICWFINGTICEGEAQRNWQEKMKICRSCEVFTVGLGLQG